MRNNSGYTPVAANHMTQSELCATCHTVITPTLSEEGEVLGEFVEQAPYLEWLASSFPAEGTNYQTCICRLWRIRAANSCPSSLHIHRIKLRSTKQFQAPPFGQHFLVGGNTQVLGMLRELFPAESGDLAGAADRTRRSLHESVEMRPDR